MQPPCVIVLLRLVESRAEPSQAEESLSEVTPGWMFIFRAANYLTTALTVCVRACMSVCHYLSESQGDVACCPLHTTTEFTERAVCAERDQS